MTTAPKKKATKKTPAKKGTKPRPESPEGKNPDGAKAPAKAPSKAPAKAPPKAPAKAPSKAPAKAPPKAPAKAKANAQPEAAAATQKDRSDSWNPNIVVFACNWCSYAGADTAGVSRIQHQPHFRMIRVMCSGRIQPAFVLHAFEKGADGVLVSGCHFGDCHYIFGNHRAVEQFEITKNVVRLLGIEEGRLRLEWISAAEGVRFAEVINEFTDQVRELGPSPLARKREAA